MRRWFLAKLTASPGARARRPAQAIFADLPNHAYLDSVACQSGPASPKGPSKEEVNWYLKYSVQLTPAPAGLTYRLWQFEVVQAVFDASNGDLLAALLSRYPVALQVFHRRLRKALAGW